MKPVVYVNSNIKKFYEDNSFIGKIKDKLSIRLLEENFIKELNLSVVNVKLPPNFNKKSYFNNMSIARKILKSSEAELAPKTYRCLDYNFFNSFQREIMAWGIVKSSKLILRTQHKSIRDSCIVIHDAADDIIFEVIWCMAKEAKYIILLSKNTCTSNCISEYIVANYGITPIVTSDEKYAFKKADFIVTSRAVNINTKSVVWYLNNKFLPTGKYTRAVNDITYYVPWSMNNLSSNEVSGELLGAILCQMEEKHVEKSLKYNGVFLDRIKFNDNTLIFDD
jgi:hypothetical protein